jgi:hypothetical protein
MVDPPESMAEVRIRWRLWKRRQASAREREPAGRKGESPASKRISAM